MDVDHLLTFERIVQEGSVSRAAWSLGLAQATVSARVQALERAVGGPLFVRTGRGVTLTDMGISFRPYARRALDLLQAGVAAAQQAQQGQRGQVSIGVLESLSGAFLGPALAHYHHTHPAVDVLVRAGRQEQLIELLHDGKVNLALVAWPCGDRRAAEWEVAFMLRERVVLVAGPTHPLARHPVIDTEHLVALAQPFLLLRWWTTLPPALARLEQHIQPQIDLPMDTGRQMVRSGVGAGFFPWMQVADALATGHLREIVVRDLPTLTRESALVYRADIPPVTPASTDFLAALHERAVQLGLYVAA